MAVLAAAVLTAAPSTASAAGDLLEDHDALVAAEKKAEAKDVDGALAELLKIRPRPSGCEAGPDLLFERASILAAELLAERDPKASAAHLLRLPPDGARLRIAIDRLRAAGDEDAAKAAEVRLLLEAVGSPEAEALAERLGTSGVVARLETIERRMERVRALFDAHVNARANAEAMALAKTVGKDHALACELGYIIGKSARKLRQYRPAIAALAQARGICIAAKNDDLARRAALLESHVRAIRGELLGTRRIAEWFEKEHAGHSYVDDAWFVVAEVSERRGKAADAKKIYELIVGLEGADQASLAAWRLAFDALEAKRVDEAKKHLTWILEHPVDRESEHARAAYWLADMEPDEKTRDRWHARLLERPTFYTWLLLDRAGEKTAEALKKTLLARKETEAKAPVDDAALVATEAYRRAMALFSRDAPDLAIAELGRLECKKLSDAEAVTLARAYHQVGGHPEAQWVLRTRAHLFERFNEASLPVWRTAYSRAFEQEIAAAAAKAKVEKWFLMGLVREESTFDPEIVSWAGAVGLAQLMPPTAIGAYAEVYGGRLDLAKLTEPELNLRLGGHVLAQGYRRFGSEPLALSAYNGGPGLTLRVLPKSEPEDFDRWVETIPVKETRRYVKRVIETWGMYRFLYDGDAPFVDLPDRIEPAGQRAPRDK